MARPLSKIASGWWDYTTVDPEIVKEAGKLTADDLMALSREGFRVVFYDTPNEFYCAEALEYIEAWKESTPDNPVGVCGPVGPIEHLPLVAMMVNSMGLNLKDAHFWGMDEWVMDGKEVPEDHPLSFAGADRKLCFDRIRPDLAIPESNMHFPKADTAEFLRSWDGIKCAVMQGGQGHIKHWAFNDPVRREGKFADAPPSLEEYLSLSTRIVDLHPVTIMQTSQLSTGGIVDVIPVQAVTVGPVQTWQTEKVSIWHPGIHDSPFGMRLTAFMISNRIADSAVPMSLLGLHPNVQFNFLRDGIGSCKVGIF